MAAPAAADLAEPPEWFRAAVGTPARQGAVEVDGVTIAYRVYGDNADDGIVLLHGGAAHARWWDHIAPLLTAVRRVIAVDLSGHGDSGRRTAYSLDTWASEALAAAGDAGITAPPILIGHSMGGFVALRAGGIYGSAAAGRGSSTRGSSTGCRSRRPCSPGWIAGLRCSARSTASCLPR